MADIKRIIRKGDKVAVTYTGTLDTGEIFDSNVGKTPFVHVVGDGQTISGFDENIIGMAEDEEKRFTVLPEKGYGQYHEKLAYQIPRKQLGDITPQVGTELLLKSNAGNKTTAKARITKVEQDKVTLDMNHPLAGKNLTFLVRIDQIF
ncbi:MAG: peptidylprolyl isomerase [DPANN group archaeon]|nr:peptidylprolyl isomerase [DPANN group archaeon]